LCDKVGEGDTPPELVQTRLKYIFPVHSSRSG
jgi:hypothetical protein